MDLKNLFKRKPKGEPAPEGEFSFDAQGAEDAAGMDARGFQSEGPAGGGEFGFQADDPTDAPGGGFGFQPADVEAAAKEFSYEGRRGPAGHTSFFGYFRKGVQLALLKGDVAEELAADEGAFGPALFIYLFPSLVIGAAIVAAIHIFSGMAASGDASVPMEAMAFIGIAKKASYGIIIALLLASLVGSLAWVGLLHFVARLFKGEGRFLDFYQTIGVGSLVAWGGVIPYLGFIFSIWSIVVNVVVTSRVHNLSTGKSVAVVLAPLVLFMVLGIALAVMIPMMFMGWTEAPLNPN